DRRSHQGGVVSRVSEISVSDVSVQGWNCLRWNRTDLKERVCCRRSNPLILSSQSVGQHWHSLPGRGANKSESLNDPSSVSNVGGRFLEQLNERRNSIRGCRPKLPQAKSRELFPSASVRCRAGFRPFFDEIIRRAMLAGRSDSHVLRPGVFALLAVKLLVEQSQGATDADQI